MNKIFRNAVLAYVVTSMASLPFVANLAYADVVASSSSGTVFGHSLETGVPVDFDESTGQVSSQGQNIIVFPQKSGAMGNVRSTYGNIPALQGAVAAQAGALENENSDQGNAYRTLKSGIHVPRPDLRNDIMITNTEAILKDTAMNNGMSQCYTTVRESQVPGKEVLLEDFKSCDRFIRPQGCQVTRQVHKAQPVTFIQGPGSGRQISLSQYEITMGLEGNDNLSGSPCKVHTQNMILRVNAPDKISRAVINQLVWDDYIQLKIGSTIVASKPGSVFPDGGTTCPAANAGGSEQTAIDITPYLTSLNPGQSIEIELKVATTGSGEGYAKAVIEISEPEQIILQEPDGCLEEILNDPELLGEGDHTWTPGGSVNNQASTDVWECLQASNAFPVTLDGGTPYTITPDDFDFLGPLYPGEPGKPAPMCFVAKQRSLGKLDACHESPLEEGDIDNGKPPQCQTIDWAEIEGEFSNCQPLQSNPDCRFKESQCVEYRGGTCSHYEDVYDCGSKVDLGETITNETLICPGSISCMGAECTVDRFGERNKDLSAMVPYLEIMKNSPADAECDQTGKGCKFFGGKPFTCKVVFGGIQDCCDQPTPGVSVVDYMKLAMASYELAKETQLFDDLVKQGAGLWRDVSKPVKSLYDQISKPMISAFDNLVASSTAGAGAAAILVT